MDLIKASDDVKLVDYKPSGISRATLEDQFNACMNDQERAAILEIMVMDAVYNYATGGGNSIHGITEVIKDTLKGTRDE